MTNKSIDSMQTKISILTSELKSLREKLDKATKRLNDFDETKVEKYHKDIEKRAKYLADMLQDLIHKHTVLTEVNYFLREDKGALQTLRAMLKSSDLPLAWWSSKESWTLGKWVREFNRKSEDKAA